eukprot:TRINITY_DN3141_c2_g1_i1.p1 TRINITY_DN3141_c2_g1~~TRINITY_DN3141_c2_g1_i1.p1  ORF type:complete len:1266 (+),score=243.01 TRINITY_DN3141_c2_g1_i1:78-3800(+)
MAVRVVAAGCDVWWHAGPAPSERQSWRSAAALLFAQRLQGASGCCQVAALLGTPSPAAAQGPRSAGAAHREGLAGAVSGVLAAATPGDLVVVHIVAPCRADGALLLAQGTVLPLEELQELVRSPAEQPGRGAAVICIVDSDPAPTAADECNVGTAFLMTPQGVLLTGQQWGYAAFSAVVCSTLCDLLRRGGGGDPAALAEAAGAQLSELGRPPVGQPEAAPAPAWALPTRPAPAPKGLELNVAVTLSVLAPLHARGGQLQGAGLPRSRAEAKREGRRLAGNAAAQRAVGAVTASVRRLLQSGAEGAGEGEQAPCCLLLAVLPELQFRCELPQGADPERVARAVRQAKGPGGGGGLACGKQLAASQHSTAPVFDFCTVPRPSLSARGLPQPGPKLLTRRTGGAGAVPLFELGDEYPAEAPPLRQRLRVTLAVPAGAVGALAVAVADGAVLGELGAALCDPSMQLGYPLPVAAFPCAAHRAFRRPHPELMPGQGGSYRCSDQWSCRPPPCPAGPSFPLRLLRPHLSSVQPALAEPQCSPQPVRSRSSSGSSSSRYRSGSSGSSSPASSPAASPSVHSLPPPAAPSRLRRVWGDVGAAFAAAPIEQLESNWNDRTAAVGFVHDHPDRRLRRLIPLYDARRDPHLLGYRQRRRAAEQPKRRPRTAGPSRSATARGSSDGTGSSRRQQGSARAAPKGSARPQQVAPLRIRCAQQLVDLKAIFVRHADVTREEERRCVGCGAAVTVPRATISVAPEGTAGFECFRLAHTAARAVTDTAEAPLAASAPPLPVPLLAYMLSTVCEGSPTGGPWEVDLWAFLVLATLDPSQAGAVHAIRKAARPIRSCPPARFSELAAHLRRLARQFLVGRSSAEDHHCVSFAQEIFHPALMPPSAAAVLLSLQPTAAQVNLLRCAGRDTVTDGAHTARWQHRCPAPRSPTPQGAQPLSIRSRCSSRPRSSRSGSPRSSRSASAGGGGSGSPEAAAGGTQGAARDPAAALEQLPGLGPYRLAPVELTVSVRLAVRGDRLIPERYLVAMHSNQLAPLRSRGVSGIGRLSSLAKCVPQENVPSDAVRVAWGHPVCGPKATHGVELGEAEEHFFTHGGFLFFDSKGAVCGVCTMIAILPPTGGERPPLAGVTLGAPRPLAPSCATRLQRLAAEGCGFMPAAPDAAHTGWRFCGWIPPGADLGEDGDAMQWPRGAFAFLGRKHLRAPPGPLDCYLPVIRGPAAAAGAASPPPGAARSPGPAPL